MRRSRFISAAIATITLTGFQQPANLLAAEPKTKLTEAEAIRIATAPMVDWDNKGTQALDSQYAPDAIGFEPHTESLVDGSAAWVKINKDLLAMKFDKVDVRLQKVQILSDDAFIFTTISDITSTNGPVKSTTWRCTDIFQRQSNGKFRTINEHCSFPPKS